MRFVIVTGMSGAGKSTALKILEDAGYFCVDNLPIPLLEKFAQFIVEGNSGSIQKVALGVDVRSGGDMEGVEKALEEIRLTGLEYEILYLDAEDEVLVKRYKETRRTHPLAGSGRVENGIREERRRLKYLKEHADYILDSSQLLTRELKAELDKIFVKNMGFKNLMITVLSFGFKYGIPSDSDLVFDVRFLPNPYYIDELSPLSGNDKPVSDYVMNCEASRKTPFRATGKCVVSASGTVRRIRSTDRAQRHRQRCHPEENERSEVREHVLFQQGERGIVQTDIYSAPLPDRGDRGHLKRLWTGQYLSQRSLSCDRTYRKCVCSKKILYINRKNI